MIENEVATEATTEEVVQNTEETPESAETVANTEETPAESPVAETPATMNARILRERADQIAKERDEALKRLREYEKMSNQVQAPEQKKHVAEEEYNISPDDLVEGKHLSKYDRKIKELEDKLANYQRQTTQSSVEQKLQSNYPDFYSVVNEANIADLRSIDPDLAVSIAANPDIYSQAKAAYNAIKRYGIYDPQSDVLKNRAQANAAKPRPANTVTQKNESPLAQAYMLGGDITPEAKEMLRREMMEARKKMA